MFSIPIILFVFNRPDLAKKQYEILQQIQPQTLIVISDAPRDNVDKDATLVKKSREIFEHITWKCNLIKNYAERNMGCDERITSGLDWAFDIVEEAIILEDDCIPHIHFFKYCEELLERYKDDTRIAYVSGTNPIRKYHFDSSYTFTYRGITWGWATWKRAWKTFDYMNFSSTWDEEKQKDIKWPILLPRDRRNWIRQLDNNREKGGTPWDFCWLWHTMKNQGLSIVPEVNLIENMGFREDATHTSEKIEKYNGTTDKLEFPLRHPQFVKLDKRYYFENWKYEKPNYLKKLIDINFYKRQWKRLMK